MDSRTFHNRTSTEISVILSKGVGLKPKSCRSLLEDAETMEHLCAFGSHRCRQLFDYLTTGGVREVNPVASVRGPKYVVRRGKTPVLSSEEARKLLDSIESNTLIGLRDRALIGTMVYSLARVGATITMKVGDYFEHRKRC